MALYTRLGNSTASFEQMMKRFGVVTVMNADVYDVSDYETLKNYTAYQICAIAQEAKTSGEQEDVFTYLCTLDTLKTSNVNMDGPTKTITGGRYNNTLIKFGKSATMEIQDALGNHKALDALCGTVSEYITSTSGTIVGLHNTEDFSGAKLIIGDSFFIDQKTGEQVKVKILFYQFMPDSLFNLTQDAEGDATVFDMNGELLTTEIQVGKSDGTTEGHGVFYSIIDPDVVGAGDPDYNIFIRYATIDDTTSTTQKTIAPKTGYTMTVNGTNSTKYTINNSGTDTFEFIIYKNNTQVAVWSTTGSVVNG